MRQTIRLNTIYQADLFTRSKAADLRNYILADADEVILDFSGISFMSRSFADELYSIIEEQAGKSFSYLNRAEVVETMMEKVSEGRHRERVRGQSHAKMYEFRDMESLSEFLLAQ